MATQKQIEANRRNAQKSTGPKTPEGKQTAALNALKHGLTAETLVLPDEDAEAFAGRVEAWVRDLAPKTEIEQTLARRAATLSWKLDRADLHEVASLTRKIRDQAEVDRAAHREKVRATLAKLLVTPDEYRQGGFAPEAPAALLAIIETTAEGCGWLIGCWNQISDAIDGRRPWTHNEEMGIIRLSGLNHGSGPIADPIILDLLVASRVMIRPNGLLNADRWEPGMFGFLADREALKTAIARAPRSYGDAAALLRAAVAKGVARVEIIRQIRESEGDAWGAAESARVASFDASTEGERLRRYQTTTHRDMIRTLESLMKLRQQEAKLKASEALRNEAKCVGSPVASLPQENDREFTLPARQERPDHQEPVLRNEASFDLNLDRLEWIEPPSFGEENEPHVPLRAAS